MKKIRTLIVDDEPLAREGVLAMLQVDAEIEVVGTCADGHSALETIRSLRPDLVFLDVQMPKRDGFGVLTELRAEERPVVIFVTAYDQYAIRAFEVSAVDYLLKPFRDDRFTAALAKAKVQVRRGREADIRGKVDQLLAHLQTTWASGSSSGNGERQPPSSGALPDAGDRIVLKTGNDLHFIRTTDIVWVESQADFVKVHTTGAAQLVRETMQNFEQRVPPAKFLRIHRSSLVNIEHVRKVTPALYGDYTVLMSDGTVLRLSRKNRGKLKRLIAGLPAAGPR